MKDENDLESLDQHFPLQQRMWRLQRVAWVMLLLLVTAGLTGVLGGAGPLASQRIALDAGWQLQVPRFAKFDAPLRLSLRNPRASTAPLRVIFSAELARALRVEDITPHPLQAAMTDRGLEWSFANGTRVVLVRARSDRVGRTEGSIVVNEAPSPPFTILTYR